MKKLTILLIAVLTFSCSSDDDSNETNLDPAVLNGIWEISEIKLNDGGNYTMPPCKIFETLTFSSGNKVVWHTPEEDDMSIPCEFLDIDMTYTISGNTVKAKYSTTEIELKVNGSADEITLSSSNWTAYFSKKQ